jgi:hypothetical protein
MSSYYFARREQIATAKILSQIFFIRFSGVFEKKIFGIGVAKGELPL